MIDKVEESKAATAPLSHGKNLLIISAATLLLLLPAAFFAPLIDRDEPRFSQATVEMIERADWIIPTFNEAYRFDKPPLTYWLMRLSYGVFGIHEFSARLHSILSTLLTCFVIYWIGTRWFHTKTALYAGLFFAVCLQVLLHGRLAVADMPMILFVAIAQLALFQLIQNSTDKKYPWSWFFLFYISLAWGFLAKGPIALFIPVLTLILYRVVLWRKPLPWLKLKPLLGTIIVLAIVGSWGIPALIETKGGFWDVGINEHIVHRGTQAFNGRIFLFFFYLITLWISFFPWSIRIPQMIRFVKLEWNQTNAFLVAWFISPVLIFSFYATQLPHYILPGYPALCLLLAQETVQKKINDTKWDIALHWLLILSVGFVALLLLLGGLLIQFELEYLPLRGLLIGFSLGIFGIIVLAFTKTLKPYWLSISAVILCALAFTYGVRSIRPTLPAIQLKEQMQDMPQNTKFYGYRFFEPSLIFYSHRYWEEITELEQFRNIVHESGSQFIILRNKEYDLGDFWKYLMTHTLPETDQAERKEIKKVEQSLIAKGFEMQIIQGVNLGRTSWVEIKAFVRN